MDFVVGIGRYHASVRFGHRRVVIHKGDILPAGILADHGVQLDDPGRGFKLLAPAEFTRGQQRAQHGGDAVGTCQLDHRHEVAQDMRQRYVTGILRYVVRPAADDNHLRVQVQHVGPEAYEHLRGGLPADAAAHITVCRKKSGCVLIHSSVIELPMRTTFGLRTSSLACSKRPKFAQSWVCAAAQRKPARARAVKNSFSSFQ